jgi:alpha-beta hydrolase superfamily lysophospholipase
MRTCAHLGDYARSLQAAISRLLQSEKTKPLVLLGHSLGGLLIKEALVQIAESESGPDLINLIFGLLFFGVLNDRLDTESFVPIVKDQPNRFLLESLSTKNSQMLNI